MEDPRYARMENLKILDRGDLEKLRAKKIAIIGVGGTGSLAADLFARTGVSLRLIDRDFVSISNLHRQILFSEEDIGEAKVEVARRNLVKVNSEISVEAFQETFDAGNAEKLLQSVDLAIDGTDNITTRMIINDACIKMNIPWVHASAIETYGQVKAVIPGKTSCLRCYYPLDPVRQPTCAEVGVLNSVPSIVSAYSWTMGIRILLGKEVSGDLHHMDPWNLEFEKIPIARRNDCESCVRHNFTFLSEKYRNLGIDPLV